VIIKGSDMKQIAIKISGIVFVLFIFTSFCAQAQAVDLPKTAKLVPPETIILVDIDNFGRLKQQFEKTNLYKLYKDPAMSAVVEDFKTKRSERIRKIDNELARTIADVDVLPQGRVAIALVLNEQTKDANDPPLLLISRWGENITKIKEVIDKTVEKSIQNGTHRKTEDYRGVSITTIIQKSSKVLHYCFIDDCLIVSVNLDVLKFTIAHIQGAASPALADDSDYTATMKTVGPHHNVDFYVNIKQIIRTALAGDNTGWTKKMVTNFGFDNVTSLGGALGLARGPGGSSVCKTFLKINGPKKGIAKMLDMKSAAFRAPRFIPASAYTVTQINFNIKKAYDELYNILTRFSPQYSALTHIPLLPASPQGEPAVQLKPDIIAHLGSQIVISRSIDKQSSGALPSIDTLVAVAINNRSALEKSLSLLYDKLIIPKNPDARRELLGHTIYLADLSALIPAFRRPGERTPMQAPLETGCEEQILISGRGLPTGQAPITQEAPTRRAIAPSQQDMPKLAFTITDTHIIFGKESVVEGTIRTLSSTGTASVASAKWFNATKSAVLSSVGLASIQDNSALGEVLWQMIKKIPKSTKSKGEDSDITVGLGVSSESPFPFLSLSPVSDLFDVGLLPEFDAVRKYFGLSAYYGISSPQGFFFESKYLNQADTD
jgi:hypothetical protein